MPIARATAAVAAGNAVRRTDLGRILARRLVTRSDNGSLIVAPSLRNGSERGAGTTRPPGSSPRQSGSTAAGRLTTKASWEKSRASAPLRYNLMLPVINEI